MAFSLGRGLIQIANKNKSSFVRPTIYVLVFLLLFTPVFAVFANESQLDQVQKGVVAEAMDLPDGQDNTVESDVSLRDENQQTRDVESGISDQQESEAKETSKRRENDKNALLGDSAMTSLSSDDTGSPFQFKLPAQPKSSVDLSSGAFTYSYQFETPKGRSGLTPELSLDYNSKNVYKPDSPYGLGWDTSIPYILRELTFGTQNLYSRHSFSSSLSGNLISTTDNSSSPYTTYRSESDDGGLFKYAYNSDQSWSVITKEGLTYIFGATVQSRQDNPDDSTKIYKWFVSSITDSNGNSIQFSYIKDFGQIYPGNITYTHHPSSPAIHNINFVYSSPLNYGATVYNAGFAVSTKKLIDKIVITTQQGVEEGNTIYQFSYQDAQFIGQKLLIDINVIKNYPYVQYNEPGDNRLQFSYSSKQPGWQTGSHDLRAYLPNNDYINRDVQTADFDNNGYEDLLISNYPGTNQPIKNYLLMNNGTSYVESKTQWNLPTHNIFPDHAIVDVNSDNLPDLHPRWNTDHPWSQTLYINTGLGFVADTSGQWVMKTYAPEAGCGVNSQDSHSSGINTFLFDINNDGKNDIVYFGGTGSDRFKVYLNNGAGWSLSTGYAFTVPGNVSFNVDPVCGGIHNNYQTLIDFNGDGLLDYYHFVHGTFLNNGKGFEYSAGYKVDTYEHERSGLGDINGDGLLDMVAVQLYSGQRCQMTYLNNGSGFIRVYPNIFPPCDNTGSWSPAPLQLYSNYTADFGTLMDVTADGYADVVGPFIQRVEGKVRGINNGVNSWVDNAGTSWMPINPNYGKYFDINSDGILDFITSTQSAFPFNPNFVYQGKKEIPNLLNKITTIIGAEIVVEYKAVESNREDVHISPMTVVDKITVQNIGLGQPSMVTIYDYEQAVHVIEPKTGQKRFSGFHKVTSVESGVDMAPIRITESYFHQGNGDDPTTGETSDNLHLVGKEYYTITKNPTGTIKKEVWKKYGTSLIVAEPYTLRESKFVYPISLVTKTSDPGGVVGTAEKYVYSALLGERIEFVNLGYVAVSNLGTYTDISGDTRYEYYSYAKNSASTFVRLSRTELRTSTSTSSVISRVDNFFDNQAFGIIGLKANLTKTSSWISGNGTTVASTTYTYDAYGNVLTEVNPRNATTVYTYDSTNTHVATEKNHLNHLTAYEYSYGRPVKVTDPNGRITGYMYSKWGMVYRTLLYNAGGLQETSVALERSTDYWEIQTLSHPATTAQHRETQILDKLGRPVKHIKRLINDETHVHGGFYLVGSKNYDALGRVISVSAPYGTPESGYDISTLYNVILPTNLVTTTVYDVLDRPVSVTDVHGSTTYLYAGLETITTNPKGQKKSIKVSAYGDITQVKEYNGTSAYTTTYTYNQRSELTKIKDHFSNVRNFTYNNAGWLISSQDLHASTDTVYGVHQYTYDLNGNVTAHTLPSGVTENKTYDMLDRLLTIDGSSTPETDYTYTYDDCINGKGLVCTVLGQLPNSTSMLKSYQYSISGVPTSYTLTTLGNTYTTTYRYNLSDEVNGVTYPNGTEYRIVAGDWAKPGKVYLKLPGQSEILYATISYHHTEQPLQTVISSGVTTTNSYDVNKLYRKSSSVITFNSAPVQSFDYSYDAIGNITKIIETAITKDYAYDGLNRLTKATYTPASGPASTYNYAYNAIGNITSANGRTYAYVGTNKTNPHAVTSTTLGSDVQSYTYDDNGNIATAPNKVFTYNWQNQMQSVVVGGAISIASQYDENGQRLIYKTPTTTEIQIDDSYILRNGVPEINISVNGTPIGLISGGAIYSNVVDHLGSPTKTLNNAGVVSESVSYGPYGAVLSQSGSLNAKKGYTGHEEDVETGLTYMEARYYDPMLNRFLSQDPAFIKLDRLEQQISDPQGWNSYSYARNNPVRLVDPDGEWFWEAVDAIMVAKKASDTMQSLGNYLGDSVSYGVGNAIGSDKAQYVANRNLQTSGPQLARDSRGLAIDASLAVLPVPLASIKATKNLDNTAKLSNGISKLPDTNLLNNFDDLISPQRQKHILYGDKTGGGHLAGINNNKAKFPSNWSSRRILHNSVDLATDPKSKWNMQRRGTYIINGTRNGVKMSVIAGKRGNIITSFPRAKRTSNAR